MSCVWDAAGRLTAITNNGTVVARYEYDAFGATIAIAQAGPLANAFTHRFSTKPFDVETGLVMYQLRPYEPNLGRWLSRDPIEERGGVNIYIIGNNDVVNKVDPLGNSSVNWYNKKTKCCGKKTYNPETQCCCKDTEKVFAAGKTTNWRGNCIFESLSLGLVGGWKIKCDIYSNITPGCEQYSVKINARGISAGVGAIPIFGASMTAFPVEFNNGSETPASFRGSVQFGGLGGALVAILSTPVIKNKKVKRPFS